METKGFFQFEITLNKSIAIRNILILPVRGPSLYVRVRRQILTYKDGPRTERIKSVNIQYSVTFP